MRFSSSQISNHRLPLRHFLALSRRLTVAVSAALVLPWYPLSAQELAMEEINLPPLRINGQPAKAHTQGLEIESGEYYVTARRDDVQPRRALLLRTAAQRSDWDVWDITPVDANGALTSLDHPGGMQSDGERLWIPLAESRRKGRSLIRAYRIADLVAGQPFQAELEFPVNDHIGAVAVSAAQRVVLGANWDTEIVYVWGFDGRLHRTLSGAELESRRLGVVTGPSGRSGLAVQDWKIVDDRLFASGLFRGTELAPESPQSRLVFFTGFMERGFQWRSTILPKQNETELAREGMAISNGLVYFLPEDLGASNRILRASIADLAQRSFPSDSHSSSSP